MKKQEMPKAKRPAVTELLDGVSDVKQPRKATCRGVHGRDGRAAKSNMKRKTLTAPEPYDIVNILPGDLHVHSPHSGDDVHRQDNCT